MSKLKKGDKVDVLDDAISGVVVSVLSGAITIATEEGFDLTFKESELVKISDDMNGSQLFSKQSFRSVISEKEIKKKNYSSGKKIKERTLPTMEVDLHLHHLVASERHLSSHDKKNIQLDTAKHKLDFAIKNNIQKIVFIHGVGEGVLKLELEYLFGRYDNIKHYEADYKKYGLGATEVYIYQNKKA